MNTLIDFFQNHHIIFGLCLGLLVALVFWLKQLYATFGHGRQVKKLKEMLDTKMQVETRGQAALNQDIEELRKQNENLRITVKTLEQKPGRAEIRQLRIYDTAIRSLMARSPGFAPAWEVVLKEAEQEMAGTGKGLSALVRRVLPPE